MKTWPPHKPPDPDWPDHVKRIYEAGCVRVDKAREQIGPDGTVPIPFTCYGCDKPRDDFAMLTGDGVPICLVCMGGPRGRRFILTRRAVSNWEERCPHVDLTTLEHAVRFSRCLGRCTVGGDHARLFAYDFDRVLFLVKPLRSGVHLVIGVFALPYTPLPFRVSNSTRKIYNPFWHWEHYEERVDPPARLNLKAWRRWYAAARAGGLKAAAM